MPETAARITVFGGAGFVGLNIVEALLARGRHVTIFDRAPPPEAARAAFAALPGALAIVTGEVGDADAVARALPRGADAAVYGAAITADAARDAAEPERILAVNLMGLVGVLRAAHRSGVGRIVNLSSGSALGQAAFRTGEIDEEVAPDPTSLYAISKFASERAGARLAGLWGLDLVNLRLSGVFGPWERATGVRDTLSPHLQVLMAAEAGGPALLARPGRRDWIYAPDVADAVAALLDAPALPHRLYNVSSAESWTVLEWGQRLATLRPGLVCRLAEPGEAATIDLHAPADRSPLATGRLAADLGWRARHRLADTVAHLDGWWRQHGRPHAA